MIELKNIYKTYKSKQGVTYRALENINLKLASTGMVFILGKSGSGKSTLLNLIGGLDTYDEGEIIIDDKSMNDFTNNDYDNYRSTYLGFVFQDYNLIRSLTVYENIKLALNLQNKKDNKAIDKALESLGILDLKNRKATELSGGQKQRVAVARAIVKNPQVILADEPTGSLDSQSGIALFKILKELSKNKLVVVVSHDKELAKEYGDRIIEIKDGEIYKDLDTSKKATKKKKEDFSIISNSIVKINKKDLNKEKIKLINETIKKSKRDTYVSFETNKNKVKSMFPHLKETIEHKDDEREIYNQYKFTEKNTKKVKFNKSKLSFIDALKLGFNNLFVKKFSLILLIIVTTLSLALYAISDDIKTFRINDGITTSITKNDANFVVLSDPSYSDVNPTEIYNVNLNNIKKELDDLKYYESYDYPFTIELEYDYSRLIDYFNGFIEVDNINNLNLKILAKNDDIFSSYNHIMISSIMADNIMDNKYTTLNSYEELLGKEVKLNGQTYYIDAIFDGESEKYEELKKLPAEYRESSYLYETFNFLAKQYLGRMFVKRGFKEYLSEQENSMYGYYLRVNEKTFNVACLYEDGLVFDFGEDAFTLGVLASNEYYVSLPILENLLEDVEIDSIEDFNNKRDEIIEKVNAFNLSNYEYYFYNIKQEPKFAKEGFTIKGVLLTNQYFIKSNKEVITDSFLENVKVNLLFIEGSYFKKDAYNKVTTILENGLTFYEFYSDGYKKLYSLKDLFNSILNSVSIILAIVVVILFYNFIKNSIRNSKKQIGLLRALGSRKIDVVTIYMFEALFIMLFSIILSLVLYKVSGHIINLGLSVDKPYYVGMISFKFTSITKMLGLALGVLITSLIVPFYKLLKLSPMDAINDK